MELQASPSLASAPSGQCSCPLQHHTLTESSRKLLCYSLAIKQREQFTLSTISLMGHFQALQMILFHLHWVLDFFQDTSSPQTYYLDPRSAGTTWSGTFRSSSLCETVPFKTDSRRFLTSKIQADIKKPP